VLSLIKEGDRSEESNDGLFPSDGNSSVKMHLGMVDRYLVPTSNSEQTLRLGDAAPLEGYFVCVMKRLEIARQE
jgi:hypothetical protein